MQMQCQTATQKVEKLYHIQFCTDAYEQPIMNGLKDERARLSEIFGLRRM